MDKPIDVDFNSNRIIGKVTHYYDKLGVAIIDLTSGKLKVGDQIKFKKGDSEFTQKIDSLQVERNSVDSVKSGDTFGLKVNQPTKPGTLVNSV